MKKNNNFKQTETCLIPEDWEVVRLGDYLEEKKTKNKEDKKLPVYSVSNIYGFVLSDSFFDKRVYSKNLSTYKLVQKDDFAYNPYRINVGSIGLFNNNEIGLVSSAYVVFMIPERDFLSEKFLFLLLKSSKFINEINRISMSRGSVRHTVSFKDLIQIKIPLPPLSEQQKIARVLSKIQEAIEQQDKIIDATKNLKKSLMQKLFTEGLGHTEFKETEIGKMPESWEVVSISKSLEKKRLKVGKIKQREYKKVGKYPVIDQGNNYIAGYSDDEKKVYEGDLPVAIFGDHTRIIKYVDFPFIIGADGVKILLPKHDIFYSKFFYYALANLKIESRGYNRHFPILKEKKITLPPLPEQQEIAHILTTADRKIEVEEKRKSTIKELFKTMLNKLMTGEIRVKDADI